MNFFRIQKPRCTARGLWKAVATVLCIALFVFTLSPTGVHAEASKKTMRSVSFELDSVEDAIAYEVEITRASGKLVGRFPLKTPVFSGRLVPGSYRLRSRSTDSRHLQGDWSDYQTFEVLALAPLLVTPAENSVAARVDGVRTDFVWEAAPGAARYRIDIQGTGVNISEITDGLKFSAYLPTGEYKWAVASLLAEGAGGERSASIGHFRIDEPLSRGRVGNFDFDGKPSSGNEEYELELISGDRKEVHRFPSASSHFLYPPGRYKKRSRTRVASGTESEWSRSEDIEILSLSPDVISPKPNAAVETTEKVESRVDFKWTPSAGAARYKLDVETIDTNGKPIADGPHYSETVSQTEQSVTLLVAKAYAWKLTPLDANGASLEDSVVSERFKFLGSELSAPLIERPLTHFVSTLKWQSTDVATTFDYKLERKDPASHAWKIVARANKTAATELTILANFPGGAYRLAVRSVGEYRKPSVPSVLNFALADGDRSPEATAEARKREFLEPLRGFYFQASYLIANLSYAGTDAETNSSINFSAIGGTGRVGVGYNRRDSGFGMLAIADLSGFKISDKNYTFAAGEAHLSWRSTSGSYSYRPSAGLYYKELVEVRGALGQPSMSDVEKIAMAGPHVGIDVMKALSGEYGLQFNARLYYGATAVKTPNGSSGSPTMSYQFGIMGVKKLSANRTGYLGYAFRVDNAAYMSTPNDSSSSTITSLASPGDTQKISITGHYLNLILELP